MTKVIVVAIIIGIMLLGGICKYIKLREIPKRLDYTQQYRNDFVELHNKIGSTGKLDDNLYYKLMQDQNKMQRELGLDGIVSIYTDPAAGLQYKNYPLILNFFNELRIMMTEPSIFEERIYLLFGSCNEALTKHIGVLNEAQELGYKKIKNPFHLFSCGISYIVGLPVKILEWCGIINSNSRDKALGSKICSALEKIVTLLSLIAAIISITTGWSQFIGLIGF